jgi:hypothetical protein
MELHSDGSGGESAVEPSEKIRRSIVTSSKLPKQDTTGRHRQFSCLERRINLSETFPSWLKRKIRGFLLAPALGIG